MFAYCKNQQGLTFIELIISMVLISISAAGLFTVVERANSNSARPMVEHQALAIAEAYLEEILLLPFDEREASGELDTDTAEAGEVRGTYDDVNDYNALPDNLVRDINGNLIDLDGDGTQDFLAYTVNVTVVDDGNLGPAGQLVNASDAQLVTVAVAHEAGTTIMLRGYRTRY